MNILVGQSGGPTAVINSSLAGIITEASKHPAIQTVYGAVYGIEGFIQKNVINLSNLSKGEIERLRITPSAYLGSCRYPLPKDLSHPIYPQLFETFEEFEIGLFLYIGGNDSMDTVNKLSTYAKQIGSSIAFIGIPKTVDNDLMYTDHCPGFGSSAKFIINQLQNIIIDTSSYQSPSVTIVEMMGRHAGWLTASSALARTPQRYNPLYIYLPERNFSIDSFIEDIQKGLEKQNNLVIAISEGIHDEKGMFISEYAAQKEADAFGHKYLSGSGKYLEEVIKSRLKVKVRSIELSLPQRCSSQLLSANDWQEAFMAGAYGVQKGVEGASGKMVAFSRATSSDYHVDCILEDVSKICNQEKFIPDSMISPAGNDVTKEFIDYCLPLIQGEVALPYKNGIVDYLYRSIQVE